MAIVTNEQPEAGFVLDDGDRCFPARRAAGCLLEPAAGDRVWFVSEGQSCFIIAVLERADDAAVAKLGVERGRLLVEATDGLELRSAAEIAITSDDLRVQSRRARMVFAELSAVVRSLFTHATRSTFVAKVIETITDRLTQSSKTSLRCVAEIDQLQAGTIDHRAKEATHLAGGKVLINGGEIAKVEAGQIHLG
jgi:hypothetical protein